MLFFIQKKIREAVPVVFGAFDDITIAKENGRYYYPQTVRFTLTKLSTLPAPACPNTTRLIPRP